MQNSCDLTDLKVALMSVKVWFLSNNSLKVEFQAYNRLNLDFKSRKAVSTVNSLNFQPKSGIESNLRFFTVAESGLLCQLNPAFWLQRAKLSGYSRFDGQPPSYMRARQPACLPLTFNSLKKIGNFFQRIKG